MVQMFFSRTEDPLIIKSPEGYQITKVKVVREDRPAFYVYVSWSPVDSKPLDGLVLNSVGSRAGLYSRQLGVFDSAGLAIEECRKDYESQSADRAAA